MRKMFVVFAATSLLVSSVAFAEDMAPAQPNNANDVLQTVPNQANGDQMADASTSNTAATDASGANAAQPAMDQKSEKPAMVKHKKHHACKTCCNAKKHHKVVKHAKKPAKTEAAPATDAAAPASDAAAPAPAQQ